MLYLQCIKNIDMKTILITVSLQVEDDVHKNDIVLVDDDIIDGFTLTRLSMNVNDHLDECFKLSSAEIISSTEV